jgi:Tol biopolymer transport system component
MLVSGPSGPNDRTGIWLFSIAGRTFRLLRDDANNAVPSPDGSHIAFVSGAGEVWQMGANGEDASRIVTGVKGYSVERVAWSPDGHRIATLRSHHGHDEALIESWELRGSPATVILSDPRLRNFCWAQNGRILFARLETPTEASANIWEIDMNPSTLRPSGEPRRLTNWAGFTLLDLSPTADGKRIAFVRKTDQSDVYIGNLEANGFRLNSTRRLTLDDRMDWPSGWLRDGKTVLFFSNRSGHFDIFQQGVNDRTPREVIASSDEKRAPQLSPDGSWILYLSWSTTNGSLPSAPGRMMRIPVSGGPPESVFEVKGYPGSAQVPRERWLPSARGYPDFRCPSLPGSLRPCIVSEVNQEQIVFSGFDPIQGRKGELARLDVDPSDSFWDLSPDGSRIAFGKFEMSGGRIRILDLAGGEPRIIELRDWNDLISVGWSADGKSLFATNWSSLAGSILRVALNGETHLLHRAAGMTLERPLPSHDGRYLIFGDVITTSNAWMVEIH